MRPAQASIVLCLATAVAGVGWALFSTEGLRGELKAQPLQTSIAFLVGAAFSGLPWVLAYSATALKANDGKAVFFSVLAAAVALAFVYPISTSPAEGVGWNLLSCVALIWVTYAFTRRFDWSGSDAT